MTAYVEDLEQPPDVVINDGVTAPGVNLRRAMAARALPGAGTVLLAMALTLPWLTSTLGHTTGAGDLAVRLPGLSWLPFGYQGLVLISLALVVVAAGADARAWRADTARTGAVRLYRSAGGVALVTAVGSVLQLLFVDARAAQWLRADHSALQMLAAQFSYRLPRPSADQLLGLPLSDSASLVLSALRLGWLLCLVGGVLLLATPGRSRRPDLASWRRPSWSSVGPAIVILLVVVFGVGLLRGTAAAVVASGAAGLASEGRYDDAASRYDLALALDPYITDDPAVAAQLGRTSTATGGDQSAAMAYAAAVDAVSQGRDAEALRTLAVALAEDPGDPLLVATLSETATRYALRTQYASVLQGRVASVPTTPLVLFTRGRLELAAGETSQSIADMDSLAASTSDTDVRSAALTYVAMAMQQTGDDIGARKVLQQALNADPGNNNVVARAMAAGLYSGARR